MYPVSESVSSNHLIVKRNEVSTERLRNVDPDYEKKTDKLLMIQMRNKSKQVMNGCMYEILSFFQFNLNQ